MPKDEKIESKVDEKIEAKSVEEEAIATERKAASQLKHSRKVIIRIPSQSRESGMAPVAVGVNGTGYLVKRDEDVTVPEGVYNVLMAAKESIYETYEEYGQKKTRFREAQRYPVVFLGYADENRKPV